VNGEIFGLDDLNI